MEYQQLDVATYETRFLRLVEQPKTQDGLTRFEIETCSLSQIPTYIALSYCWGSEARNASIEVDGKEVVVTRNLADALYHCNIAVGCLIWVDAICINQADKYEKSYQVRLMGQIYSKANKTIVWLGHPKEETKHGWAILQWLRVSMELDQTPLPAQRSPYGMEMAQRAINGSSHNPIRFSKIIRRYDDPVHALHGLHDILSRAYWERIWIVQELAKASKVVVLCGTLQMDLEPIFLAARAVPDLSQRKRHLLDAIQEFRRQEHQFLAGNTRMSLLQGLITTRYSRATDSRDKIYALLGLTHDGADLIPFPSYTETECVVFSTLTSAIFQSQPYTNAILLPNWMPLCNRHLECARWVVDWADLADNIPPWLTKKARKTAPKQVEHRDTRFENVRIYTRGRVIGIVNRVEGVGNARVNSPQASATNHAASEQPAVEDVLNGVRSDILERMTYGRQLYDEFDKISLTDALSRMIRDADKGVPTVSYDFNRVCDVLERLSQLVVAQNPLWEWARRYNALRAFPGTSLESLSTSTTSPIHSPQESRRRFWRRDNRRHSRQGSASSTVVEGMLSPNPNLPSVATFRALEAVIATLDPHPEYRLRFASVSASHSREQSLALVTNCARPGDEMCEVDCCGLPVVLRRQSVGALRLIGEACVGQDSNGNWFSAAETSLHECFVQTTSPPEWHPLVLEIAATSTPRPALWS